MSLTTLQTNDKNDIFMSTDRGIGILTGVAALVQSVRESGLMRTGEDIYDVSNGVDYMGTVFSSPQDLDGARISLSRAILKNSDVLSIESLILHIDSGVLNWTARLTTVYGMLNVGSQL